MRVSQGGCGDQRDRVDLNEADRGRGERERCVSEGCGSGAGHREQRLRLEVESQRRLLRGFASNVAYRIGRRYWSPAS